MSQNDTRVLLSPSVAAERLGVNRRTIHRWGLKGDLTRIPVGTFYAYDAAQVEQLREQRAKDGAA